MRNAATRQEFRGNPILISVFRFPPFENPRAALVRPRGSRRGAWSRGRNRSRPLRCRPPLGKKGEKGGKKGTCYFFREFGEPHTDFAFPPFDNLRAARVPTWSGSRGQFPHLCLSPPFSGFRPPVSGFSFPESLSAPSACSLAAVKPRRACPARGVRPPWPGCGSGRGHGTARGRARVARCRRPRHGSPSGHGTPAVPGWPCQGGPLPWPAAVKT